MKTITLRNSFHNTEINVRGPWRDQWEAWEDIQSAVYGSIGAPSRGAKRRLRRIENVLCGVAGCTCGTVR